MDMSCETEILFSALEFANTLKPGGLASINLDIVHKIPGPLQNGQVSGVEGKALKAPENNSDMINKSNEIVQTLKEAIVEIVTGVEFDHTKFEQDHWKFQVVSILFTLAMRDELQSRTEDSSDVLDFLGDFPNISLDLAFELVKECDLHTAFMEFLQNVDPEVTLHIFSYAADYLRQVAISHAGTTVEWHNVLFSLVTHLLLHSEGLVMQPRKSDLLDDVCVCVTKLSDVMTLFARSDVANSANLSEDNSHRYLVPGIVGLLNFTSLLHSGSFISYDVFAVEKCGMDIFTWPKSETLRFMSPTKYRPSYKEHLKNYQFQSIAENDLIQSIFEDDMKENLKRVTFSAMPDCKSDILKNVVANLKALLLVDRVSLVLHRELGFAKDPSNVTFSSQMKWNYSCINRLVLQEIFKQLVEFQVSHDKESGHPDQQHCYGLYDFIGDPTLMQLTRQIDMPQAQQIEKAIFIVGEKLHGFETQFDWLLSVVHDRPCIIKESLLKCFTENSVMLCGFNQAHKVMDICMALSDDTNNGTGSDIKVLKIAMKKLLRDVFGRVSIPDQCELLAIFYSKVTSPARFLEASPGKTHAAITSMLNKLVGMGESTMISEPILCEFAVLALEDPETLVKQVVQSAVRNSHHVPILGKCLQIFKPVGRFTSSGMNETLLSSCLGSLITQADSLTEKQIDNFLNFVKFLVRQQVVEDGKPNLNLCTLVDVEVFLWNHTMPLVLDTGLEDLATVCMTTNWVTALKLLNCVLEVLNAENRYLETDQSTQITNSMSPLALLGVMLVFLNDVCAGLEVSCNRPQLDMKTLVITCVELLIDMIMMNIDGMSVHDMRLVVLKLSELTEWYIMGYLYPIMKYINTTLNTMKGKVPGVIDISRFGSEFSIHIPNCLTNIVCFEGKPYLICDIESPRSNALLNFLRFSSVSDGTSKELCENVRTDKFSVVNRSELLLCLTVLLPSCLPTEWKRIHQALLTLAHKRCFEFAETSPVSEKLSTAQTEGIDTRNPLDFTANSTGCVADLGDGLVNDLIQCQVYEYMLEASLLTLMLRGEEGGVSFDGMIKGLQSVYGEEGLCSVKNTLVKYNRSGCFVSHLSKLCQVIGQVAETLQDQLMTILLDLLGILKEDHMKIPERESNTSGRLLRKGVLEETLRPLPQNMLEIISKKMELTY